ncbi:desmoplakin-B isoform X2 [Brachyhypopomus gauderio]|uniref:desmoplakin-B isoform X2 n=1 Tax=Brachyhypopomus gauderio TaxID=698409 RepID=UPI0040411258
MKAKLHQLSCSTCPAGPSSPTAMMHQRVSILMNQCQEFLRKADFILQTGADGPRAVAEAEHCVISASETIEQMKVFAMELRKMGQPNDGVIFNVEQCCEQLRNVHTALTRKRRGSASWDDAGRSFHDAIAWITQQKGLIETSPWGDDVTTIEQQIMNHSKFHSSIQRSIEMEKAREELRDRRDKANLYLLEQEWDSLQKLSFARSTQLRELQGIIEEISREIMWVNDREEEELVFDWGHKNIDAYIPKKQEDYSRLMSELEMKEKELNKLKAKVDNLLTSNHPASDKIEAYMETLQTQWSWLLQITKCIHVHLKENAAYSQFFLEANETYGKLQRKHEALRQSFTCDKTTPLRDLQELLTGLERERDRLMELRPQMQQLVHKSKSIVRLRERNAEEKSSSPVLVQALCDYRQDQKVIHRGDEGILQDNSQRSKWHMTGPGGLDMQVPSVCLLLPPPNPLCLSLATKNEKYYDAVLSLWNQLYINIKSLISWQYCLLDINHINTLTISMLSQMRPEEYRSIIKSLETHYQEFQRSSVGSEMFGEEDKRTMETQYSVAQQHYDQLIVQLPAYSGQQVEEVKEVKVVVVDGRGGAVSAEAPSKGLSGVNLLSEVQTLQLKLEEVQASLSAHLHITLGSDAPAQCGHHIAHMQVVQKDVESLGGEFLRLKEHVLKALDDMEDVEKAEFLHSQLGLVGQRMDKLRSQTATCQLRLKALMSLLHSLLEAEDVVKVYEARLTEKDTSSLDPVKVQEHQNTLRMMRSELAQKQGVLNSLEMELTKARQNTEHSCQKCDMDLSQYAEHVKQLSSRWKRIQTQINRRLGDLDSYRQQLLRYLQSSSSLSAWIDETRDRIDAQQVTKTDDVTVLTKFLNQQKALNSEIAAKRETVEGVQRDGDVCVNAIKDYELALASYSAGLETLLNIPIKRSMLQSPSSTVVQELSSLHGRYLELLTRSNDFCRHLGSSLKSSEELKMRNTKIDLLEEELRLLRAEAEEREAKHAGLQDVLSQYQLQLSQSQDQLLSLEKLKRNQAMQCSATQDRLSSSQSHMQDLLAELQRLKLLLEEECRNRKVVEDRYNSQQKEHENVVRKSQKELEGANWAKIELEKVVSDRTREVEHLRRQLEEETRTLKEVQKEVAKVRQQHEMEIREVKRTFESQILVTQTNMETLSQQKEDDSLSLRMECNRLEGEHKELQEELRRVRLHLSEEEAQRRRAEELLQNQKSATTDQTRQTSELETKIQLLLSQKSAEESRKRELQESSTRALQEKSNEIACLKRSLEDELRKKRALETEMSRVEKELADLQGKHTTCCQELVTLRSSQQEISILRVQLDAQDNEKNRAEQNITQLQARIQELQKEVKRLDGELEEQRRVSEEEAAKRRRTEAQLENTSQAMREYTSTITTLRKSLEEATSEAKETDEECRRLKEALDHNLKEHGASFQRLATLEAEVKSVKLQLVQEQGRVREGTQRYEALHRSMEEKTRSLNETTAEVDRLKKLTETLTKERLRLEEELRGLRLEHEELLQGRHHEDEEMSAQISALQQQLQSSQHSRTEYNTLVQQLAQEREQLRLEIEDVQKHACETSKSVLASQTLCTELQQERDALIRKMKMFEQDATRMQTFEEELKHIKQSLESELRLKTQLQDENEKLRKDFNHWKNQYESQEERVQQYKTQRMTLEGERNSSRRQLEQLQAQLKELEDRHRLELQTHRESLENELTRLRQKPGGANRYTQTDQLDATIDPSNIMFDGVRKKVMAQQLLDCGVIDKTTLGCLVRGQKTVEDVAVNIKLNLKGTGAIAGLAAGPTGKMTITEAKRDKLISTESALNLLEAQAATGHIMDPRANVRMTVEEACLSGLVDKGDKPKLLAAEAASTGFKDPNTNKMLSASQATKKGLLDQETALRLLQAQEAAGGILDPVLSVYLPKDVAMDRNLIDEDLYQALNAKPKCYVDPETCLSTTYVSLKMRCKADPNTGMLLLTPPQEPVTVQGLRGKVFVSDLVEAKLLETSDIDQLREGKLTSQDIEHRLRAYLGGSTCIAGVYDEAKKCTMPIFQAMKEGLLRPGTTLELLEAQAASGFMIDPVNNQYYTVEEACKKGLVGVEFKDKLLSAEKAVTGYKDPGTDKVISLFQAIERGLIEKGHGIRLLEAQIASGGIIDPKQSHRIDVDVAYRRGYFDEKMNQILKDEGDDTKGFFDPNTQDNLTYLQLKSRCVTDDKTGLVLLPLHDKSKTTASQKNSSTRKTRVVIVDPDTNKEMTVHEAYEKQLIDYETFLELSQQECEWEEISVTSSDGTSKLFISDRKTGLQYDLQELLGKGLISQDTFNKYRTGEVTITQFVDIIKSKTKPTKPPGSLSSSSSSSSSFSTQITTKSETVTCVGSSPVQQAPSSPNTLKRITSMSITLTSPGASVDEQSPVGAIFDTENMEKISVYEAVKRGLVDAITAQRLLESQACTGGVVDPESGRRISIQEATRAGVIDNDMANRLKPAQKAYVGFEDLKTKKMMSVAEAVKEKWLPYEAGQRFLEFQFLTGGLYDPGNGCRCTLDEAISKGWLDRRSAQKLLETRHHSKMLTCPKTKLRISYKEAMDACMLEDKTGVRMLPAATTSSHGVSSSNNSSSGSGSGNGSPRGSEDHTISSTTSSRYSSFTYSKTSFSTSSQS